MTTTSTNTNILRCAALTLLALIMTCAAAWAQEVVLTFDTSEPFYFTGNQIKPIVTWVTIIDDNNNFITEYDQNQFTVTYGTNIDAGENRCEINVRITADGDYQGSVFTNHYPIVKRPMTVNINNCEKHYGAADPAFTWQLVWDNEVQQDSINNLRNSLLPKRLNGHLTRTAGETMGDYTISYEGTSPIELANYQVTVSPGTMTITAPDPSDFSVNANSTEYTIHTVTGWNFFCDALQDLDTYNRFSGKTVKLGANISVTRMAGSSSHDFCGTFDGQDNTITVSFNSSGENTALFSYISNTKANPNDANDSPAAIRNLKVTGTINVNEDATHKYAGGLVGSCWGVLNIENCRVSTVINSHINGDGTHGGFVGRQANGTLTITGCVFDGSLLTDNSTNKCGGFVGWKGGTTVNISNSLFAPAEVTIGVGTGDYPSATFSRNGVSNITNCYYTEAFGTAQGKQRLSITAGDNTTVGHAGEATHYTTSGITAYKATGDSGDSDPFIAGLKYNNVLYAGTGDAVSLELSNSFTEPLGYQYGYTITGGATLDGTTLTMANADVTVTVDTESGLRSTGQPISVTYIKADGTTDNHDAIALDKTMTSLSAGWYYVGIDIDYTSPITLNSDIDLILGDGAEMSITYSHCIDNYNYNLTIYSQSLGNDMGKLTVSGFGRDSAILVNNLTVNGGNISAESTFCNNAIFAEDVTINRGTVSVYAHDNNDAAGIRASRNVTISGGNVTAIGNRYGIYSLDHIILGWSNSTDFIYASSYSTNSSANTVKLNKAFIDEEANTYSSSTVNASAINGKTLYPYSADFVYKSVAGYSEGNDKWVFISSPVSGSIAPDAVANIFSATEYDLYRFNQSDVNGKEWQNYKAHTSDFSLVNGQGYLYATKENKVLVFSGTFNTDNTKTVDLVYDNTAELAGWNLVGNPFAVDAYVNRPFYKMNADGTGIEPVDNYENYAAVTIPPCTGVLVKANGTGESVTFSTTAPNESAAPNQGNLQIALAELVTTRDGVTSSTIDNAIVSFNDGAELGKFYFGTQNANIYIPQGNEEYAIAFSEGQGEMPLNFKANKDGEYTLTVSAPLTSNLSTLTLIDNLTGTDVDLLATPNYTFEGRTTDYASRFKLVFMTNNTNLGGEDNDDFAFIDSNGNLIVNGDGIVQIIDVMGRIITNVEMSYYGVSTNGMAPGVYVLRLINGENVNTQKIVVR